MGQGQTVYLLLQNYFAKKFYQKVFNKDNKNSYVKKRIFEIEYEKITNVQQQEYLEL